MAYQVIVNKEIVKEYPFKIQAVIYCFMNGYVYHGYDEWRSYREIRVLDNRVEIREV